MRVFLLDERGERIGERDWPCVPRVGEGLILDDPLGAFRILDVLWDGQPKDLIARVRLRPFDPDRDP